jgi:hypothetical protein
MPYCNYCGEKIDFRYTLDGRCVPIHPSGQCYGRSYSHSYHYRGYAVYDYAEQDFCTPSKCSYCGDDVFFIRHNGGSVWIEPPLGWPWHKHPCYYDNKNDIGKRYTDISVDFGINIALAKNINLGLIVREGNPFDTNNYTALLIKQSSIKGRCIAIKNPSKSLLGSLVLIDSNTIYTLSSIYKIEFPIVSTKLLGLEDNWLNAYYP